MKKENLTLCKLIEHGLCAAVWIWILVDGTYIREYEWSLLSFVIHIICALLFVGAFIQECIEVHKQKRSCKPEAERKP